MDYKEILQNMYDDFVEEHGREPTLEEYNDFWPSYCSRLMSALEGAND